MDINYSKKEGKGKRRKGRSKEGKINGKAEKIIQR